jgi:hypothetical protein
MTPEEIAELALERAASGFEEVVREIVQAADGDTQRLAAASRIVGDRAGLTDTPEHIAFAYIAAAFREMTKTRSR